MSKTELTNMVMIQDPVSGKVLVQERVKSWKGLSFPGGHVNDRESFVDSAIREVKEETGLDVSALQACGVIHWCNTETSDRYMVFLYKTTSFSGELLHETDEGKVFWVSPDEIGNYPTSNDFGRYLPMFFTDNYSEAYGAWNDKEPWEIVYK